MEYMIPFGDGPLPLFKRRVAQTMIMNMNMLGQAQNYVYMSTSLDLYRLEAPRPYARMEINIRIFIFKLI